jgi:hypothetical protein
MNPTVKRLAALAALGTTIGIVAPVASAGAAGMPAAPKPLAFPGATGLPAFNLPAFDPAAFPKLTPGPLTFAGPSVGQVAAVIGPTIITTAPSTFINTNNQVSAGGNVSGGQVALP